MVLGLLLLAGEMLAPGSFFFMFLGASGLIVGLLALLFRDMQAWVQWLLFSVFAVVSLVFFRKPLMERFHLTGRHGKKVDSLVGETATAMEDIATAGIGKAELRGAAWSALNVGDQPLSKSQRCRVEHVDGLTLHVRRL